MDINIYQIDMDRDEKRVAFQGLEELENSQGSREIDSSIYDRVFSGNVECEGLEEVFQMFNVEHPDGYTGHSLSVSDIVEVINAENVEKGFYYCENIGFKKVDFDSEEAESYREKKIKVLMVEPGMKAYETKIGTNLEEMYAALDCDLIQTIYPYDDLVVIVCDDEGKLTGKAPNRAIYGEYGQILDVICGKFFVCDCSTSELKSLPSDMMEKYKKMFYLPQVFAKVDGKIAAMVYDPENKF